MTATSFQSCRPKLWCKEETHFSAWGQLFAMPIESSGESLTVTKSVARLKAKGEQLTHAHANLTLSFVYPLSFPPTLTPPSPSPSQSGP